MLFRSGALGSGRRSRRRHRDSRRRHSFSAQWHRPSTAIALATPKIIIPYLLVAEGSLSDDHANDEYGLAPRGASRDSALGGEEPVRAWTGTARVGRAGRRERSNAAPTDAGRGTSRGGEACGAGGGRKVGEWVVRWGELVRDRSSLDSSHWFGFGGSV